MGVYGDLVTNSSFTAGMTGWWSGDPAKVTVATPGIGIAATATIDAVNPWDALFGQDNITLRNGCHYTLSFTARASQPGTVLRAQAALTAAPYTPAVDKTVTLGTVDRHYVFPFTSTLATTAASVSFQFGQSTPVTVYVTEVRLTCSTVREGFYVDPNGNAATWAAANPGDPRTPKIVRSIAQRPGARWYGDWTANVTTEVAAYTTAAAGLGKVPILTAYNIYNRDNGGESSGGAFTPDLYEDWIDAFAAGLGDRPALVILEPDALAQLGNLPPAQRTQRLASLNYAVTSLAAQPLALTYLDGGNATWIRAAEMATRLKDAGIAGAHGFAVGVSNFDATDVSCTYGNAVTTALTALGVPGKRFVVDTARNGNGAMTSVGQHVDYCNPSGRRLGVPSSIGVGGAEYLLWIKYPGDSDGQCGTAPPATPAGTFSPFLAENLIDGI
ncbi:glycoside hydrolase family 6 protein [Streptomyces sp. NPDC058657]|uniref:glycoside hydrolase family 6 protein n=1 Tax=unclassified Streptomyces TaxID=2593676 RepID=UPI00364EFB02